MIPCRPGAVGKTRSPFVIEKIQRRNRLSKLCVTPRSTRSFSRANCANTALIPKRVRRPEDLGDIFTTPEDLRTLPAEDFLCREPELVFETTGTSGGPKRVYYSYEELDFAARYEAAALYENGVRPGDRVVCTFDAGYWISSWVSFLACK